MATPHVQFFDKELERALMREANRRLDEAAEVIKRKMQKNLSTPGPPASRPGDFPHMDSGELRESIDWERDGDGRVIGSPLEHSVDLEMGTPAMAPRPWAARSMSDAQPEVQAIFDRPAKI